MIEEKNELPKIGIWRRGEERKKGVGVADSGSE